MYVCVCVCVSLDDNVYECALECAYAYARVRLYVCVCVIQGVSTHVHCHMHWYDNTYTSLTMHMYKCMLKVCVHGYICRSGQHTCVHTKHYKHPSTHGIRLPSGDVHTRRGLPIIGDIQTTFFAMQTQYPTTIRITIATATV